MKKKYKSEFEFEIDFTNIMLVLISFSMGALFYHFFIFSSSQNFETFEQVRNVEILVDELLFKEDIIRVGPLQIDEDITLRELKTLYSKYNHYPFAQQFLSENVKNICKG